MTKTLKAPPLDSPPPDWATDDESESVLLLSLATAIRAPDNETEIDAIAHKLLLGRGALKILRVLVAEVDELTEAGRDLEIHETDRRAAADELDRLKRIRPMSVEHSEQLASRIETALEKGRAADRAFHLANGARVRCGYLRACCPGLFGIPGDGSTGLLAESRTIAVAYQVAGFEPSDRRPLPWGWRGPSPSVSEARPRRRLVSAASVNQERKDNES